MTRAGAACLALILMPLLHPAGAVTLDEIEVTRRDDTYRLAVRARVDAAAERVTAVLTDYAAWPRLNDAILESIVVATTGDGRATVRSTTRACILIFCRTVRQTQILERDADGAIVARTLPHQSDFSAGMIRWRVVPDGRHSRITLDAELTPSFWIPPLIGPYAVQHVLRREAEKTLAKLESRAMDASDWKF